MLLRRDNINAFYLKSHAFPYRHSKLSRSIQIDFCEEDVKIADTEVYSASLSSDQVNPVPSEAFLFPQSPIEFAHNRKLTFGHFISKGKDSSSVINVIAADGTPLLIDSSQIISVWNHTDKSTLHYDTRFWENIAKEALAIFRLLPPRKKTLAMAWEKLIPYRRKFSFIDSYYIGLYLFYENHFTDLINPSMPTKKLQPLTPVQRYAAAVLLHSDRIHFKRRISTLINQDTSTEGTWIAPGGYTVLPESIIKSNSIIFHTASLNNKLLKVEKDLTSEQAQIENLVEAFYTNKFLQSLQVYAFSDLGKAPKQLGQVVKAMTKATQCTTEIARDLLNKFMNISMSGNTTLWKLNGNNPTQAQPFSSVSSEAMKAETLALEKDIEIRNKELALKSTMQRGRYVCDFRAQETSPVITIDTKNTEFFDDGFSISPETNELYIHVVDISKLQSYPNLLQHARERMFSQYTPMNGTTTRMLPPKVLDMLKLSSQTANEVITVAVLFDPISGDVLQTRVFPSIIGPVHSINLEDVDEILTDYRSEQEQDHADDQSQAQSMVSPAMRWSVPVEAMKALSHIRDAVKVLKENDLSLCRIYRTKQGGEMKYNPTKQQFETQQRGSKEGHEIIDTLLTLYSNTTYHLCREAYIPVPIVWENRDKGDTTSSLMRRFATQPLRNFISFLQQIQLRAALHLRRSTETYKTLAAYVKLYQLGRQNLSKLLREKRKLDTLIEWE